MLRSLHCMYTLEIFLTGYSPDLAKFAESVEQQLANDSSLSYRESDDCVEECRLDPNCQAVSVNCTAINSGVPL